MSIPSQASLLSFAPQAAKIGDGAFNIASHTWTKIRASRIGLGPQDVILPFPLETGGPLTITAEYKAGTFYGGEVDIVPRAEEDLGWLLYAALGNVSSNSLTGEPTVYQHDFKFATDGYTLPWMAFRHEIPGNTKEGLLGYDCKINRLRIVAPQMGLLSANFQVYGRCHQEINAPNWSYGNDMEDHGSSPLVNSGSLKIDGVSYPITSLVVEFFNNLSDPQMEYIQGSPYPDDFIVLGPRVMQLRMIYKYAEPVFIEKFFKKGGSVWSPEVYETLTNGGNKAFEVVYKSPKKIASTSENYAIKVSANRVSWKMGRPMEMVAGAIASQEIIGTVIDPTSGDVCNISLVNAKASYVWPS